MLTNNDTALQKDYAHETSMYHRTVPQDTKPESEIKQTQS